MFRHNMQFSLVYGNPKDWYEDGFVMGTACDVNIKKNKLCPKFVDIPCVINADRGGAINEISSFFDYICKPHIGIIKTGSYYSIKETIDLMKEKYPILENNSDLMWYYKSIRKGDLVEHIEKDHDLLNFLQIRLIDRIDEVYPLQRKINGDYQKELMTKCKYFNGFDPYTGEISENRSNESSNNESIVESESNENSSA